MADRKGEEGRNGGEKNIYQAEIMLKLNGNNRLDMPMVRLLKNKDARMT